MTESMPQKWDVENYPLHMRGDVITRNQNIDAGRELCDRCNGTGNELYSMYRKCQSCDGNGYLEVIKTDCPVCGECSLVEKEGEFCFDPPPNIPGGVIPVPDSVWRECESCKEIILPPELIKKLEEQRALRISRPV